LVTVIPNGVDCKRFHPEVASAGLRAELGLEDKFAIIFVGALTKWHRYKGLDVLLAAVKIALRKGGDLRLMVVGDGTLREQYQSLATQLGISANVLFLGNVADAALPEHYSASDAAVLPSKDQSEGFGLTILEANATGKPVIASNVGGIPSVVSQGHNGLLVPPNDAPKLAEALLHLSKNREAADAMGRNGRAVAEEHDWKKTAALTTQVYVTALAP
jgi:glycosyltransferase involved in cell wall biosynthesis